VTKYLLDTCFLSEGTKPSVNAGVASWILDTSNEDRFVSVIALAELKYGILRLPTGKRRDKLAAWYETELRPEFDSRVLGFDEREALEWAKVRSIHPNRGLADSQIAATALVHGLTLVTRNVTDFPYDGLAVSNPWR